MGTTTGLKPDSIYLDRDTGTFNRVGGLSDIETSLSVFPDYAAEAIADAQARDYINSLLEEQGVPDQISNEEYFAKMTDTLKSLGIDPEQYSQLDASAPVTTIGQSQDIDLLPGLDAAETDASIVEKIQEKINKAASAVGKAQDMFFDIFGIPRPDYSVIQPNAPGGTVIWGQPSGGVFGRIGTTPGGTKVGVQTGIPALDILLGRVADIVSGRVAAGEILNSETIWDIIIETTGDKIGISDPNKVVSAMQEISNQVSLDKNTGRIGIDLGGGADAVDLVTGETATLGDDRAATLGGGADAVDLVTGETVTLGDDRAATLNGGTATLDTDRAATLNTGRAATLDTDRAATLDTYRAATLDTDRAATLNTDRAATLDTDRSGYFDPTATERTGTLDTDRATTSDRSTTSDRAPGGGGVGLGETGVTPTGGIRGVATEQAGVADITMLYDPSLSLAENMARILGKKKNEQADAVDSVLMYGGGIVQPTDLNAEIRRIIEGR